MQTKFRRQERLIQSILDYQRFAHRKDLLGSLLRQVASLRHKFWSTLTASDIHRMSHIRADLVLPHPNGIVIHQDAVVGPRCILMQQVTIGILAKGLAPVLGSDVYVGAGAKVLGGIHIGDRVWIGANAVVLKNVPDDCSAVGIPARIIHRP
jgi:serine O-acetyltransferase